MHKKVFVLCFTSLLALASVPAHAGEWFTDEASGCQAWNNFPQPDERIVWSGACKDGKVSGPGSLKFLQKDPQKSSTVNCSFVDGKCEGPGTTIWANGNRREGNYVDNYAEGKGIFVWVNGDRYEGDFVQGKRTGKGSLVWANGNRYTGDFVDGVRTGKGVFAWADGSHYEGDFVQNKRIGKGVMTWPDGNQQEGDFVDGKPVWTVAMKWINDPQSETLPPGNGVASASSPSSSCLQVPPDYPFAAGPFPGWDGRITGQVKAQGLVANGVVQSVQILSGPKIFHDVVRAAMLQYKCPGVAGPVSFSQEFEFANPQ